MEILLHSLEYFATMARLGDKSYKYPRRVLPSYYGVTCLTLEVDPSLKRSGKTPC